MFPNIYVNYKEEYLLNKGENWQKHLLNQAIKVNIIKHKTYWHNLLLDVIHWKQFPSVKSLAKMYDVNYLKEMWDTSNLKALFPNKQANILQKESSW